MPGIGIGLGLRLGGGGTAWSEADVVRMIAGSGLDDAGARAAISGATSLAAGLRVVGLLPARSAPQTPAPAITPLPAGIAAMWDPASLVALANGVAVASWTDAVAGTVAANTADSTTPNTYIANSGGLPAVRLSGQAVMVTAGSNAAATALASGEFTALIVLRNILDKNPGQQYPHQLATNMQDPRSALGAAPTYSGRYGRPIDCTTGMRTLSVTQSGSHAARYLGVNGTAVADNPGLGADQIQIGGYQSRATLLCGKGDVLAVIAWNRPLTAAELKQVHRHYCDLLGQARPGGGTQPIVSFSGDSLTGGYEGSIPEDYRNSYGYQMASALGWTGERSTCLASTARTGRRWRSSRRCWATYKARWASRASSACSSSPTADSRTRPRCRPSSLRSGHRTGTGRCCLPRRRTTARRTGRQARARARRTMPPARTSQVLRL